MERDKDHIYTLWFTDDQVTEAFDQYDIDYMFRKITESFLECMRLES